MAKSERRSKDNDKTGFAKEPSLSVEEIAAWLEDLPSYQPADWSKLPDIGLYMDQVLTLMDRQLTLYKRVDEGKLLTQPMINNYTKDGLLPRASDKKYSQSHLALLTVLCSLKPVLSIADLTEVLRYSRTDGQDDALYALFLETQRDAISKAAGNLVEELENVRSSINNEAAAKKGEMMKRELANVAMQMAIEARVRIMMTQKIIDTIRS